MRSPWPFFERVFSSSLSSASLFALVVRARIKGSDANLSRNDFAIATMFSRKRATGGPTSETNGASH